MSKTRRVFKCTRRTPGTKCPKPRAITAHEALSLLESAVSYCQSAGLNIAAANGDNGTLKLFISNAHYILTNGGTHAVFRLSVQAKPTDVSTHRDNIGTRESTAQTTTCPNCAAPMEKQNDGTLKCTRCYWYLTPQELSAGISAHI